MKKAGKFLVVILPLLVLGVAHGFWSGLAWLASTTERLAAHFDKRICRDAHRLIAWASR